jgi:hypothetical protein
MVFAFSSPISRFSPFPFATLFATAAASAASLPPLPFPPFAVAALAERVLRVDELDELPFLPADLAADLELLELDLDVDFLVPVDFDAVLPFFSAITPYP